MYGWGGSVFAGILNYSLLAGPPHRETPSAGGKEMVVVTGEKLPSNFTCNSICLSSAFFYFFIFIFIFFNRVVYADGRGWADRKINQLSPPVDATPITPSATGEVAIFLAFRSIYQLRFTSRVWIGLGIRLFLCVVPHEACSFTSRIPTPQQRAATASPCLHWVAAIGGSINHEAGQERVAEAKEEEPGYVLISGVWVRVSATHHSATTSTSSSKYLPPPPPLLLLLLSLLLSPPLFTTQ